MKNKFLISLIVIGLITTGVNLVVHPVNAEDDHNFWYTPPLGDYDIFAQPEIIYPTFWEFIQDYALWGMQYNQEGHWVWVNDSLEVGLIERHNKMKIWLNFTTGERGDYRLNLRVNIGLLNWSYDPLNDTFALTYLSFGNMYVFSLNFSDLRDIGGLSFLWGVISYDGQSFFQFNATRRNAPGGRFFSFDPEYQIDGYPQTGTDASGYGHQRKICRTSDGVYHLVFYGLYGTYTSCSYTRSVNGGITWSTPLNLTKYNTTAWNSFTASICVDKSDILTVVFSSYCGDSLHRHLQYRRSTDKGVSWSSPVNITSVNRDVIYNAICVDTSDRVHCAFITYTDTYTANYNLAYTMYSGGVWSAPVNLTKIPRSQTLPSIAVDSSSNVHLAWQGTSAASGIYAQAQIKYLKKTNATGLWSNLVAPYNITRTAHAQGHPCIAIDGLSNVHVVWVGRHAGSATNMQVRYCKYFNANSSWKINPVNLTTDTLYAQTVPTMTVDYQNNIHIMWSGKYAVVSPAFYAIRHLTYDYGAGTWTTSLDTINSAAHCLYPNAMWSYRPTVGGKNISRPKSGYCFFFSNGTTLKFWTSDPIRFDGSYSPTATNPSPTNASTGNYRWPRISFLASDLDGNTMTVTWQTNATDGINYVTYQVNNSIASGTTVRDMNFTFASGYNKYYWWKVWLNDGTGNNRSYYFYFRTHGKPVVFTDEDPANESTCVEVNPFISITAEDPDGQAFDIYWYTNHSHQLASPLRPDGNGVATTLLNNTGAGFNYEHVDEIICDDTTTYVYTLSTTIKYDYYRLPNVTHDQFHIFNVAVHMMVANFFSDSPPDPTGYFRTTLANGSSGDKATGTLVKPPSDNVFYEYTYVWDDNPWSGVEWTWEDIDNLEAGVGIRMVLGAPMSGFCSQVWLVVNEPGYYYIDTATNASVTNGTYHLQWGEFNEPGTTYWWFVEGWDGENDSLSSIYHFTLCPPPGLSGETPANGSTGVSYPTTTCVVITYDGFDEVYYEKYEWYYTGATGYAWIGQQLWAAQNFTVGTVGTDEDFYIYNVTLMMVRETGHSIGNITVHIRDDISGPDLCHGHYDGDLLIDDSTPPSYEWVNFTMNNSILLSAGGMYYIIVSAVDADTTCCGWYYKHVGAYTGGWMDMSNNYGLTWTNGTYFEYDYAFEVWGTDSLVGHVHYWFWTNESGTWQVYDSGIAFVNGTYCADNNFTKNDTTYYWNVSLYLPGDGFVNESYHFTTAGAAGGVPYLPLAQNSSTAKLLGLFGFVIPYFMFIWRRRKRKRQA